MDIYLGVIFWTEFQIVTNLINEVDELQESSHFHVLHNDQKTRLQKTISAFPKSDTQGLGKTTLVKHIIDVGDASRIKKRHFHISPAVEKLMCEKIHNCQS